MTINSRIPRETHRKPPVGRFIEQDGVPLEQQCFEPDCFEQVYRLPTLRMVCLHGHQQIPPHARSTADDEIDDATRRTTQPGSETYSPVDRRQTISETV